MQEKSLTNSQILPSKKQRELLSYIDKFIQENGYSPSYREIMSGLKYNSVATVALHVNNLIKRGQLIKRDHSARSLELVAHTDQTKITTNQVSPREEKWLVEKVEHAFTQVENTGGAVSELSFINLNTLVNALRVLGLEGASQSFAPRLNNIKNSVLQ